MSYSGYPNASLVRIAAMLSVPDRAQPLHCHASTPCRAVRRLLVTAARPAPGSLALRFELEGNLDGLRIPAAAAPTRADELWRHTCFEAFVGRDDSPTYCEFNFSPSYAWAAYRFGSCREGMRNVEAQVPPAMVLRLGDDRMLLEAHVDLAPDAQLVDCVAWRCNLAAVIEEADGRLSYWALAHPRARPDFHAPEGFTLALPITGRPA